MATPEGHGGQCMGGMTLRDKPEPKGVLSGATPSCAQSLLLTALESLVGAQETLRGDQASICACTATLPLPALPFQVRKAGWVPWLWMAPTFCHSASVLCVKPSR